MKARGWTGSELAKGEWLCELSSLLVYDIKEFAVNYYTDFKKNISRQGVSEILIKFFLSEGIFAFSRTIKARNELNGLRCKCIALDQWSILRYTLEYGKERHKIPMVQFLFVRGEASTLGFLKAPQVILMCDQSWESLI